MFSGLAMINEFCSTGCCFFVKTQLWRNNKLLSVKERWYQRYVILNNHIGLSNRHFRRHKEIDPRSIFIRGNVEQSLSGSVRQTRFCVSMYSFRHLATTRANNRIVVRSYCSQSAMWSLSSHSPTMCWYSSSSHTVIFIYWPLLPPPQSHLAYGGGGVNVGETIPMVVGIICPEDNGGVLPLLNLTNWLGFSLIASS